MGKVIVEKGSTDGVSWVLFRPKAGFSVIEKKKMPFLSELSPSGRIGKKRLMIKRPSAYMRRRRKKVSTFTGELKDMRKLPTNDEAFRLSFKMIREIIGVIRSCKTPTPSTFRHWDEYARSFYRKMCICFRADYQNLESATPQDPTEPGFVWDTQPPLKGFLSYDHYLMETSVGFMLKTLPWPYPERFHQKKHLPFPCQLMQPAKEGMSYDDFLEQIRLQCQHPKI